MAAEFLVLGAAIGKNGPPSLRNRMETRADPNRESHFHPTDAAGFFLPGLPVVRKAGSLDAPAKNWDWPIRDGCGFCHSGLDSSSDRRRPNTPYSLADS